MNRKSNDNGFVTKEKGPIWNVKVGVYTYLLEGSHVKKIQSRRWKIKEILN
ncbi:MAG TPA: hypothetical protein VLQ91_23225 [Draconibacterium sp.]|nr:hypothetical protein [Draconibacterium sp.]